MGRAAVTILYIPIYFKMFTAFLNVVQMPVVAQLLLFFDYKVCTSPKKYLTWLTPDLQIECPMKLRILLFSLVLLVISYRGSAIVHHSDEILSWITLTPKTATPDKVTTILGAPVKTEESKKKTWWYYTHGNAQLVIVWNNKTNTIDRFSFTNIEQERCVFDGHLSRKLHSGITNMSQAISILGVPKDMTIREVTQEIHYAYKNSVLRLFFRNRLLVDFTLLSQNSI